MGSSPILRSIGASNPSHENIECSGTSSRVRLDPNSSAVPITALNIATSCLRAPKVHSPARLLGTRLRVLEYDNISITTLLTMLVCDALD